MMNVFDIDEIIGVIKSAQRRADRLREPQAVVDRRGVLVITHAKYADNPIEICWPCDCEVCA